MVNKTSLITSLKEIYSLLKYNYNLQDPPKKFSQGRIAQPTQNLDYWTEELIREQAINTATGNGQLTLYTIPNNWRGTIHTIHIYLLPADAGNADFDYIYMDNLNDSSELADLDYTPGLTQWNKFNAGIPFRPSDEIHINVTNWIANANFYINIMLTYHECKPRLT